MNLRLEQRVNTYGSFLKQRYGERVFKAGIKTGLECPHRSSTGGCIFCLPETFTDSEITSEMLPSEQLRIIIPKLKKNCGINRVLAYFQDNTSTSAEPELLKKLFDDALTLEEVVGVVISTRPDALDDEVMKVLRGLEKDVYLEIGVQSIHEKSLSFLNRGHGLKEVETAIELAEKYQIELGVHLILGIPEENEEEMIETITFFNQTKIVRQLKFHNLVVFQGTELSRQNSGIISKIPSYEQYIRLLGNIVPYVGKDKVISRFFTSNLSRDGSSLNPFPGVKRDWLSRLEKYFNEMDIYQGTKAA